MTVAILSDTHVPDRETGLPYAFRDLVADADYVIHARDFTDSETLAEIRDLATNLTAVHGNMDEGLDLPYYDSVTVNCLTFVVTHCHVGVRSKEDWMRVVADTAVQYADAPRVGLGGHSHVLKDEHFELFADVEKVEGDTIRVLKPGSATGADPAKRATMLTAEVDDGDLDVTVQDA